MRGTWTISLAALALTVGAPAAAQEAGGPATGASAATAVPADIPPAPETPAAPVPDPAAPETSQALERADGVYDPAEGFNRRMYSVHDAIDNAVLEPAARGYRAVTPRPVRSGVRNFLQNLRGPVIFANDVLQGEFKRAGQTAGRFLLNSTLGVAGVIDVAEEVGIAQHDEDFGQTLAVWGVSEGPYLFIPLIGPTNVRDGAGRIVDIALNPLSWTEFDGESAFTTSRYVLGGLSAREGLIETVDTIRQSSTDPYVTYRSSYELSRESAIRNGPQDVQDLPEFEDIMTEPTELQGGAEPVALPEPAPGQSVGEGTQGKMQ